MYCPEDYPGSRPMSKDGIIKWLQVNEDYLQELERLVKRSYCYPEILERVCYEFLEADFDEKVFSKAIKKYFPELDYDFTNHMLTGSYNGESITLITDRIFFKNAEPFMDVLRLNDACRVGIKRKDKGDETWETVTLYQALYQFDVDYKVKVDQRFKGLGEMGDDILFATVVNPLTRKLIRLENIKSVEDALNTMKILHSRKIPEERRNILSQNRFKYSDIDN